MNTWTLDYFGYTPGVEEYATESLLTVGNGFIGLRGTTPEMKICDEHYPATYLAGLYNIATTIVSGKSINNEDFVNAPNLQFLTVSVDGEPVVFSKEQIGKMERHLDLKSGLFTSKTEFELQGGKKIIISTKKVVSMANRNIYGISYSITPVNFEGIIHIISEADGDVYNYNVPRYRSLNNRHLHIEKLQTWDNYSRLVARTETSNITILQESKLLCDTQLNWENNVTHNQIIQTATVNFKSNETITVEKLVYVEIYNPESDETTSSHKNIRVNQYNSFNEIYSESQEKWAELWKEANIEIEGDQMSEMLLHLHTYHLLVSASPLSASDLDVSVTARGLHGEAYRGHIFWDELYIFPFYIMHFPKTAKDLLMYRYNRLDAAKDAAKKSGYDGAMFPWQSGLDGTEQTQELHLNPLNGKWDEDRSRLQRHVSLAISYNIWLYYKNTDDIEFMNNYGLEMLLEITLFWISLAKYNNKTGRYSIKGVMGPDEFHEAYPHASEGGITDNAYTNIMVVWLFEEVQKMLVNLPLDVVSSTKEKTCFSQDKEELTEKIIGSINLEINKEGIIAQFAGYLELKEIDWDYYKNKYGDTQRMDRVIKADGHLADEYQVTKQADLLMTFYNLEKERIDSILKGLCYEMPDDYFKKNLDYYIQRTSHGSTLSRVVHTKLAAMAGKQKMSWQLYQDSLFSDYNDIQGGTTAEGIHTGVMAATVYITLNTYGGIDIRKNILSINPNLPKDWKKLRFNLYRKGVHYTIEIYPHELHITADKNAKVIVEGNPVNLVANHEHVI